MQEPLSARILELVRDIYSIYSHDPPSKRAAEMYCLGLIDIVRGVEFKHPTYGVICDLDWLRKEIMKNCDRLPTVKDIRAMYEQYLIPKDELKRYGYPEDYKPLGAQGDGTKG